MNAKIFAVFLVSIQFGTLFANYGEGLIDIRSVPYSSSKGGVQAQQQQQGQYRPQSEHQQGQYRPQSQQQGNGGFGFGTGLGSVLNSFGNFVGQMTQAGINTFGHILGSMAQFAHLLHSNSKQLMHEVFGSFQATLQFYVQQAEKSWSNFVQALEHGRFDAMKYLQKTKVEVDKMIAEFYEKRKELTKKQLEAMKSVSESLREKISAAYIQIKKNAKGRYKNAIEEIARGLKQLLDRLESLKSMIQSELSKGGNGRPQGQRPDNGQQEEHRPNPGGQQEQQRPETGGQQEQQRPETGGQQEQQRPETGGQQEQQRPETGGQQEQQRPETGGQQEQQRPATGGQQEQQRPETGGQQQSQQEQSQSQVEQQQSEVEQQQQEQSQTQVEQQQQQQSEVEKQQQEESQSQAEQEYEKRPEAEQQQQQEQSQVQQEHSDEDSDENDDDSVKDRLNPTY